jgi:hypothetical protein
MRIDYKTWQYEQDREELLTESKWPANLKLELNRIFAEFDKKLRAAGVTSKQIVQFPVHDEETKTMSSFRKEIEKIISEFYQEVNKQLVIPVEREQASRQSQQATDQPHKQYPRIPTYPRAIERSSQLIGMFMWILEHGWPIEDLKQGYMPGKFLKEISKVLRDDEDVQRYIDSAIFKFTYLRDYEQRREERFAKKKQKKLERKEKRLQAEKEDKEAKEKAQKEIDKQNKDKEEELGRNILPFGNKAKEEEKETPRPESPKLHQTTSSKPDRTFHPSGRRRHRHRTPIGDAKKDLPDTVKYDPSKKRKVDWEPPTDPPTAG